MKQSTILKAILGTAAIGSAYLAMLVYSRNRKPLGSCAQSVILLEREKLIEVLKSLLREFHGVLVEMATMVQRLKQLGALRGPDGPMSAEQIAEFLLHQGIQSKLDAAQSRVLIEAGVTQEQVEEAQERLSNEDSVTALVDGFSHMFDEASQGLMPILPGLEIPGELTEDKALEILNVIHQERFKGFRAALEAFWSSPEGQSLDQSDSSQGPPPALAKALQSVHDEAEQLVLELHSDTIGEKAIFDSAVALFSRNADGAFMREKLRMERSHQVEIVNLMRNRNSKEAPKLEPVEGIHPRLKCSSEADMAHQILEAAEMKKPVVTALVRNVEDPKSALGPLSEAIEGGKLQMLVERDCTFLYMAAHDDIPLANRPEFKTVEVCYIFFPRPDKQQRPVACFSLDELAEASSIDTSIYEGPGSVVFNAEANRVD
jgi:hypothetical protein